MPTDDYSTLDWSVQDRVLTLTLNRPDQLNAFTVEMAHELVVAYGRAADDDGVRSSSPVPGGRSARGWT